MPSLDLDFVRTQFPAFAQAEMQGQVFLENAGGSFMCKPVMDRLTRFYHTRKVQPYYAYPMSRAGGLEMDEARSRLSAMMGAAVDEISFGPSTTQNSYVLARAFGQILEVGDAIIITNQDHEANRGPWARLAQLGIEVRLWEVEPDSGSLKTERLAALLDDKVRLVCFPHCSNLIAEINPVKDICALVKKAGAYSCVDGVSYTPHGFPNVKDIGADIYLFSAYKTYGPHQGIMYVNRHLAERLPNQGHHFNGDILYKRLTPAGPDHAQVAACAGMVDYIDDLYAHHRRGGDQGKGEGGAEKDGAGPVARNAYVHDLMRAQEIRLMEPLLDYLGAKNSVRLLGPKQAQNRAPTLAMILENNGRALSGGDVAATLAGKGIMCAGGSFYSPDCLRAVGGDVEQGVLRLSFVHYTSEEDIERTIKALDAVLG